MIFRDGRLLISKRKLSSHLGGLWEFPGGKLEAGETFQAALMREIREELGTEIAIDQLISTVEHSYPEKTVLIRFYKCQCVGEEPTALDCEALKWVAPKQLRDHSFPKADDQILDELVTQIELWV